VTNKRNEHAINVVTKGISAEIVLKLVNLAVSLKVAELALNVERKATYREIALKLEMDLNVILTRLLLALILTNLFRDQRLLVLLLVGEIQLQVEAMVAAGEMHLPNLPMELIPGVQQPLKKLRKAQLLGGLPNQRQLLNL